MNLGFKLKTQEKIRKKK